LERIWNLALKRISCRHTRRFRYWEFDRRCKSRL
jgi:hypothetical protein